METGWKSPVCQQETYCENRALLLAQYNNIAVIPLEWIVRDFFRHLTVEKFLRKQLAGEIALPVVRMEASQKTAKGAHVADLAAYLDRQAEAARRECQKLAGAA
jgi:Pyocin activator protein PrtN